MLECVSLTMSEIITGHNACNFNGTSIKDLFSGWEFGTVRYDFNVGGVMDYGFADP